MDVVGITLQIAAEAVKQLFHEVMRVALGICDEHVVAIDGGGEEVAWSGPRPTGYVAAAQIVDEITEPVRCAARLDRPS